MSPHTEPPKGASSKLFEPMTIGNGKITLSHRIVLAPLTRNRGVPLNPKGTTITRGTPSSSPSENSSETEVIPNRIWYPDSLVTTYYSQRTTPGGLLISEGLPPSLESNGMPGVPGLFHPSQVAGWKDVVSAIHSKGGFIYAQIWHAGRASIPQHTGMPTVSASATPYEKGEPYPYPPPGTSTQVKYEDFPPTELSVEGIKRTIGEYVKVAKAAIEECGFDGVEVHSGNGYLPEQFLSSNINVRTDDYGGSPEKRCRFVIELMDALGEAIGDDNLAIRLTPFGLYNQARSAQRVETWGSLCRELKKRHNLSYVHFIEPRYEQVHSVEEKNKFLEFWGLPNVDLSLFRSIFSSSTPTSPNPTPFFSAGGWNDTNMWGAVESGSCDALAIGRYFLSTPDLVERLKKGRELNKYDRSRFYGPFPDREVGYTDYKNWEEEARTAKG